MLFSRHQWLGALAAATAVHALVGLAVFLLQPQSREAGPSTRSVSVSLASLDATPAPATSAPAPADTAAPATPETTSPTTAPTPESKSPAPTAAPEPSPDIAEAPERDQTRPQERITPAENVAPETAGPAAAPEVVEAVTVSPETTTARTGADPNQTAQPSSETGQASETSARGATPADAYVARVRQWLARNKSYPQSARRQGLEGVVRIRFAVDRQGRVLDYRIVSGSGHALLDQEVEAMIERAQPLPSMPGDLRRTRMELIVPIRFSLRQR